MELTIYDKKDELTGRIAPHPSSRLNQIYDLLEKRRRQEERILVRFKDKILPICYGEIALFHLQHELIRLVTFGNKVFYVQRSLEELEDQLGSSFYRVNRQFLVNKNAILDLTTCGKRTIMVNLNFIFPEKISVSKHKCGHFLDWLA